MLLTIITRTYKRPIALAACQHSLEMQTYQDFEHLIIRDDDGVGIPETYRRLAARDWSDVKGKYVYLLDDDNLLNIIAVQLLRYAVEESPDLIFVKAEVGPFGILPRPWESAPVLGQIDLGCVVLRRDLFFKAAPYFGVRYEGDYDYIEAAWKQATSIMWMDRLFMIAQRVSGGQPE